MLRASGGRPFWKTKSRSHPPTLGSGSASGSQHCDTIYIASGDTGGGQSERRRGGFFGNFFKRTGKSTKISTPQGSHIGIPPPATPAAAITGIIHGSISAPTGVSHSPADSAHVAQDRITNKPLPGQTQPDTEGKSWTTAYTPPLCRPCHGGIEVTSTPSSSVNSLWRTTLGIVEAKLLDHGLPALDLSSLRLTSASAAENIQSIIGTLKTAQKGDEKENHTDEKEKNVRRNRISGALRSVEKYTKIVDTAVQHSPEVTSLVWACVRAIIQVSINHLDTMECLEETMMTILEKVGMCDFYAGIYAGASTASMPRKVQDTLQSALPQLYAAVIVFSIKAREYFLSGWMKKVGNTFKPFDIEFGPFIEEINAREKVIRECADGATMERIKMMEDQIGAIRSELQPLVKLNQDMSIKATKTLDMTKQIYTTQLDENTYELLKKISPLEPLKRHEDIKSTRLQNSGTWLLQLRSFEHWSNSALVQRTGRLFCCYGMPGAGKTVMSSLVIDDLNSRLFKPSKIAIACLYCDYRDQDSQTFVHILGCLLRQFLSSAIPQEVAEKLQAIRKNNRELGKDDLLGLLKVTLQHLERAFICIDALDELQSETRSQFLQAIKDLSTTSDSMRLFLTGRKHIQGEVQRLLKTLPQNEVEIMAHSDDIRQYLKRKIAEDTNPDAMDDALENDILTVLVERSQKMFLLPVLHIKMVLEMTTKSKRRKALQALPPDLSETFEAIIARIQSLSPSQAELGVRVLMWLHVAYRPFELVELQHALSVETGQTELDTDNIPSPKIVLECCLGLVVLEEETKTVRFVHYTLEEFFRDHGDKHFENGYNTAAETCLTYLNFGRVAPHCTTAMELEQMMVEFAFLKYAALNWGSYVARQCDDVVQASTLKLLQQIGRTCCPLQVLYYLLQASPGYRTLSSMFTTQFSGLHVAAHFGLVQLLPFLWSIVAADLKDDQDRTPLSWAARRGHEAVVRLLLARNDVDINTKDSSDQTPLSWAARNGHEAVVRLLLARDDVAINTMDSSDQTPLSWAARNGHEAVVRLLLARDDVAINTINSSDQTPLSWAAGNGHEAVVRLLLARDDVDIDTTGRNGRTPLSLAAQEGHKAVVRLLLARNDVDINTKDSSNSTPLSWAAGNGHEAVVRLLLARDDVDVNTNDGGDQTPLSWAAQEGREAVVRLLLARDDVDINTNDSKYDRPPLSYAAANGDEAVVRLLLARDDVDINAKNSKYGETPLSWAAANGHEAVVRLLLARDDVDINTKDYKYGQTPLSLAAQEGHEAVVRLLLARDDVDINTKDSKYGQTPLSWAAANGHEAVVRLLLARDDVDINTKDSKYGQTPLSWAAVNGHEAVVRILAV